MAESVPGTGQPDDNTVTDVHDDATAQPIPSEADAAATRDALIAEAMAAQGLGSAGGDSVEATMPDGTPLTVTPDTPEAQPVPTTDEEPEPVVEKPAESDAV